MSDTFVPLTEQEQLTLRKAAFGAVTLVSLADPGAFSSAKENTVGAKVLTGATGVVGRVLSGKQKVSITGRSTAEVADEVLPALTSTMETLRVKAAEDVQEFRRAVTTAVAQAAASTHGGASPAQTDMITKIAGALGDA